MAVPTHTVHMGRATHTRCYGAGAGSQKGPRKGRGGPANALEPRTPSHGLHRFIRSIALSGAFAKGQATALTPHVPERGLEGGCWRRVRAFRGCVHLRVRGLINQYMAS